MSFSLAEDWTKRLYYGDNLEVMKRLPKGVIDLIYIDPPFNSKRNYSVRIEDRREAFKDTWNGLDCSHELEEIGDKNPRIYKLLETLREIADESIVCYMTMISLRILYMREGLKEIGSFYLHCDPSMSHYLRLLCDLIFGEENFRNEIIWHHPKIGVGTRKFTSNTDNILYYTCSESYTYHRQYSNEMNELYNRWSKKIRDGVLYYREAKMIKDSPARSKIRVLEKKLGRGLVDSDIVLDFNRRENRKAIDNVWKYTFLKGNFKESLGYPTQKPEALLERIIEASSNEGDFVADFFCGCGTTLAVAERLHRKWLGVDTSPIAIKLTEKRLLQKEKIVYSTINSKDVAITHPFLAKANEAKR